MHGLFPHHSMIEIHVHNVVCQVFGAEARHHSLLNNLLAYREDGYMFSPAYKNKSWDGYNRLYNMPAEGRPFGKHWTGLLHRVAAALTADGAAFQIKDCRLEPPLQASLELKKGLEHRYYQADAEAAAVARTRGIIRVATAGGKNPIAVRLLARLNVPSIFIAHKINLIEQSKKTIETALGVEVGIIQAGNRSLKRFNVATVQTLDSILWSATDEDIRRFIEADCLQVIVDEVHHVSSPSYQRVLSHFLSAYYRFGLSATPSKTEGAASSKDMRVEGAFGRVIYAKDRTALTEEGFLAKAHVFFL